MGLFASSSAAFSMWLAAWKWSCVLFVESVDSWRFCKCLMQLRFVVVGRGWTWKCGLWWLSRALMLALQLAIGLRRWGSWFCHSCTDHSCNSEVDQCCFFVVLFCLKLCWNLKLVKFAHFMGRLRGMDAENMQELYVPKDQCLGMPTHSLTSCKLHLPHL